MKNSVDKKSQEHKFILPSTGKEYTIHELEKVFSNRAKKQESLEKREKNINNSIQDERIQGMGKVILEEIKSAQEIIETEIMAVRSNPGNIDYYAQLKTSLHLTYIIDKQIHTRESREMAYTKQDILNLRKYIDGLKNEDITIEEREERYHIYKKLLKERKDLWEEVQEERCKLETQIGICHRKIYEMSHKDEEKITNIQEIIKENIREVIKREYIKLQKNIDAFRKEYQHLDQYLSFHKDLSKEDKIERKEFFRSIYRKNQEQCKKILENVEKDIKKMGNPIQEKRELTQKDDEVTNLLNWFKIMLSALKIS